MCNHELQIDPCPVRVVNDGCAGTVETDAQDGLPIPVALPVEMKLPHMADAAGAISNR